MSHRIKKPALKWAWSELRRHRFDPADREAGRLLTAAALTGLHQQRERLKWRQPLPAHTGLEFEGERVMLGFDPEAPHEIGFPVPEAAWRAAGERFQGGRKALQTPLQIIALKALEANFEWISEPGFEVPEGDTPATSP